MTNSTSNTYQMKRIILTFTNKISKRLPKPERKFTADITYGMLAAESWLFSCIFSLAFPRPKCYNSPIGGILHNSVIFDTLCVLM